MRVVGKNIFERIASPDDWIMINRSLKEKSVGRLYSPLPKKVSESILARLANYDLSTLYTINNRLLNLIQVIHHEVFHSCWPQIDEIIENSIKSVKDELSDLKDISDYLCKESINNETINNEAIRLQMVSKRSAVKIFPTFGKLIVLQQVIQKQIESTPLGKSKVENFLQSYFYYPFTDENSDEAIIYCLTRDEKTDHLRSFLDHYEGREIDPDSIEYTRNSKLKLLLNKRASVFQEAIADHIRCLDDKKKVEFADYKVDLTSKSNSLRFLQKESVQSLYTALSNTNNSNPPSCTFSFTKPFSVFKSEASIVLMREELQRLLLECHKLLKKFSDDGHLNESYFHPKINSLELVSLYFFGCCRIQSDLIKQDIFDITRDHLLRWADLFSQQPINKHNESVSQVAMAVHAFYLIKSGISPKFAEPINQWLFSKQYPYGHWQDNDEPLHTTILVLDALELLSETPHPTFDILFDAKKEPDGIYLPDRIRFQGKECDCLTDTEMQILDYMWDKRAAKLNDVATDVWRSSIIEEGLVRTMLSKLNRKLKACKITMHFSLRSKYIVKK